MSSNRQQIAMRVSLHTIIVNSVLSGFKLFAGIAANSAAMLSDAVHSLSDVLSTIVVMIGVRLAAKEPDKDHPYGHERLECVAALLLAGMLFATGIGIGYGGVVSIWQGNSHALPIPGFLALIAAIISIAVKEGMYWYTRAAAQKINSGALLADAWHHRSDALSSIGSFIGIFGARLGFPVLDAIACIGICFFIVRASYHIFKDAVAKMTDKACEDTVLAQITEMILSHAQVIEVDQIKTRVFGDRIYVDVEISLDSTLTLEQSHAIAHCVHDTIEQNLPKVKHCMVHTNPCSPCEAQACSANLCNTTPIP